MFKRISTFCLCILVILLNIGTLSIAADEAGSPKHIPRVVSVVFDDSGSMKDSYNLEGRIPGKELDRWAYASYAMQAFIAMMGSEDKLYITKLEEDTVEVNLSNKNHEINKFKNITRDDFTSDTYNVVKKAVEPLLDAYENYGTDAKYYLVAMSDGLLQTGEDWATVLKQNDKDTKEALDGADFSTIFFSMGDLGEISGIECEMAKSGEDIVSKIKKVSNKVMGRTDITNQSNVRNGVINFQLKYPALSFSVFVQKADATFEDIRFDVKKDGRTSGLDVEVSTVKCPVSELGEVKNPPAGFVANITNGTKSISKGKYEIDLSEYNLEEKNIVILVEPAVRVGCKYYIDGEEKNFDEIRENLRDGDELVVKCALYEMNDDGSLGSPIPDNVLSPDKYSLTINGSNVTEKVRGEKNAYKYVMSLEDAGGELKVEAALEGYQPFVMKETFGMVLNKKLFDTDSKLEAVKLTKPLWKDWKDGKGKIEFALADKVDMSDLEGYEIRIDGYDGLVAGELTKLGKSVKLDGKKLVYVPSFASKDAFANIPDKFTVQIFNPAENEVLLSVPVSKVTPSYKIETNNALEDDELSLGLLEKNKKGITFTLYADYESDGKFVKADKENCEEKIEFTVKNGILPGTSSSKGATAEFVPSYDKNRDKDVDVSVLLSKDVTVYAEADVDGVKVESEKVKFGFASASYKLVVENEIKEPFTLDSIKVNDKKIVFRITADYENDGTYGELGAWDFAVYDDLKIDSADLPGRIETEYDRGGKPVGKSFTPLYDEYNNNGIPFTAVSGKTHTVTATHKLATNKVDAKVEVLPPKYDVSVRKDGLELENYFVNGNRTEGVEFVVKRDDRILTTKELDGLAPYNISVDKYTKTIKTSVTSEQSEDGTGYLKCIPDEKCGFFSLFAIWDGGDVKLTLTVGNDSATANIRYSVTKDMWTYLFIAALILLAFLYILFCYITLIQFYPGRYYIAKFARDIGKTFILQTIDPGSSLNVFRLFEFLFTPKVHVDNDLQTEDDEKRSVPGWIWYYIKLVLSFLLIFKPYMKIRKSKSIGTVNVEFRSDDPCAISIWDYLHPGTSPRLFITENVRKEIRTMSVTEEEMTRISMNDVTFKIDIERSHTVLDGAHVSLNMGNVLFSESGNTLYMALYITNREQKRLRALRNRMRNS